MSFRKLRLGICLSYYNDRECLKRLLQSLKPPPHKYKQNATLIAIDGRYRGYDQSKPDISEYRRSTDGSYELIEQYANKFPTVNTVTPVTFDEREKRQKYVDIASTLDCDFILITNSDEWFEVLYWEKLFSELDNILKYKENVGVENNNNNNVFSVHCVNVENTNKPQYRKRLWHRPELMQQYRERHWESNIRGEVRSLSSNIIQVWHDPAGCRSAERQELQRDYESRLGYLKAGHE
jgi:hypothetical protein